MNISLLSQKGGTGKSSMAMNIAIALAAQNPGKSLALIDADEQRTIMEVTKKRRFDNLEIIGSSEEPHKTIMEQSDKWLCVIDTPPHTDRIMRLVASVSDIALVVCQASVFDVRGILPTIKNLAFIQEKRQEKGTRPLHCRVLLNRIKSRAKLTQEARNALETLCPFPVLDTEIHDREAFKQAGGLGMSVLEQDKKSPAAQEIQSLLDEIIEIKNTLYHI